MPLTLFKRKTRDGRTIWWYKGTIAGHRRRGSTRTSDKETAARIASKIETKLWSGELDGPQESLTFPQAVALYLEAEKPSKYLPKIVAYWGDKKVKDMTSGAIRQSAIDLYPDAGGATRNRQVITPTRAVINHCAELERCAPRRVRGFKFDAKIKKPVTLDWLDTFCAHARPLMAALTTLMFATACRFGEAKRVGWKHIDFKARTVLIRDTKTGKERLAHMQDRLLVALANLPRDSEPFDWSESSLRRFWDEDIAKTAEAVPGFERLTFHCCRHGFATKMLRDHVDPKTAARLGGWDDIGLFMKTYAHAMEDTKITDGIFGSPLARDEDQPQQIQGVVLK
jgi:integrase